MRSTTIRAAPADLTAEQVANVSPIAYSGLAPGQREIVDAALQEGRYETCSESAELERFVERVERTVTEQSRGIASPRYLEFAYLYYDGDYYELHVTVEDLVVSG